MWDDLADFEKGFSCCCGSSECGSMLKYEKMQEKNRLQQFLMGLDNSRFRTTRSNLLSRQMELNVDSVYSQIIQEERHLSAMRTSDDKIPAVGFSATIASSLVQPTVTNAQAAATRFTKSPTVCSHCGKQGHDSTICFQVIGYPDWWDKNKPNGGRGGDRGTRGRDVQGRGRGGRGSGFRAYNTQIAESTHGVDTQGTGIPNFTADQWTTLAQFLNNQKSAQNEKLTGKEEKLLLFGKDRRFDIVIDSRASHHMTGDVKILTDVMKIAPCPISLPNGQIAWATSHGSLNLAGCLVLRHVFFAPSLSVTLISVAQLLRDVASFVLFTKNFCVIQDLVSKTLIGAGRERNGVYHYEGAVAVQAGRMSVDSSRDLWHHRMDIRHLKFFQF